MNPKKLLQLFYSTALALFLSAPPFAAAPNAAAADCDFRNKTPVSMLSAGFEAWKVVTDAMRECGDFSPELDQEFRTKQPAAFSARPSQYTMGGVANGTLVPLLNDGTVRKLDDYVAKYGGDLLPAQLIRNDGDIVAVAMMVNAQHLMYRSDILTELNISPPKNYDEVLAAAAKIKRAGAVEYPLGGTYKSGWNLAQEFVNMYLGFGGNLFRGNRAAVNNAEGVAALEMMKKLTEYMDPEYLVADSTYVQQQFQQGKIAIANLWGSRAAAMDDPAESKVVGKVRFAAAPAAVPGGKPATTMWWDGMVVAKNTTDAEADAAFRLMMQGLSPQVLSAHKGAAVWLTNAFPPSYTAVGVLDSSKEGAPSYPSSTEMGVMHTALGNNLADFFTGKESAKQTLADIEADYATAAKEKGIL